MDEVDLQAMIPPKQQNPLLKRKPLQLGTTFSNYNKESSEQSIFVDNPLTAYEATLLYFAAGWCNISKPFSKKLAEYYQEINLQYKKLEIIFISVDRLSDDYEEQIKFMPWVGISYNDSRISGLKQFYNIRSVPTLLLIDKNGQQVSRQCRQDVYNLGQDQAFQKWKKQKQEQDNKY